MTDLTQAEFDRIDRALAAVIGDGEGFGDFLTDFALSNADRLEKYGLKTRFSPKQREMIRKIEARIKEMEDAGGGDDE